MTRVGYIGLGMMGSAMVERLCAVDQLDEVWVHDLNEAAVDAAVALGARRAASAAEVARRTHIVSVCVPAAEHVQAVLRGPAGLLEATQDTSGAPHASEVLIHSTVHPDTITQARAGAAKHGLALFDASVAGGDDAARAGALAIFAGGFDRMSPATQELLGLYGTKVIPAGPVGSGAALKLAVNVMTYSQFAAAAAAHSLVDGQGGDTEALLAAWRHTGMLGALTERFAALLSIPPEHVTGGLRTMLDTQVGIARKDLSLAAELMPDDARATLLTALTEAMATTYGVAEPLGETPTP
ncbi:MAG: NAD(P)-binding domain-containing protein [Microthrixaceae bacterium]